MDKLEDSQMKMKNILREPLLYLLPLLIALFLVIVFIHPKISDVKLTRNNVTENVKLPYTINMHHNEVFFASFNLTLRNKTAKFNIIPDDCIQEILINGKKFPLAGIQGLCDCDKGANFDFSEYVHKGVNHFEVRIINSGGGPAGFNIKAYGGIKQFSMIHYIAALLSLVSIVLIIIKFKSNIASIKNFILSPEFSKRQHYIIFALILLSACFLRLWDFGATPAGLNQDELSMAYDSYADLVYGIDRNGDHNAVYAVAFGCGEFMGYNYVLRPFVKIFGFNAITIRLPMLIFSIISLIIFYLLLKHYFDKITALLGFFLLALNPWHIMLSRWAFGGNLAPLVFLIGIYFTALSYKKPIFFIPGMFMFAYSCYAYMNAFILCAVFIPLLILYVFIRKAIPLKYTISGILTFALAWTPLVIWMVINAYDFPAIKFMGLSIPRMTVMRSSSVVSFSLDNFTRLGEILFTGQDGLIHNALPKYGTLYPFMLPFLLLGAYVLFFKYKKAVEMKFWLISSIFLALIISVNINRANLLFFPLIFLATLGIAEIHRQVKLIVPIMACLIIITTINFANTYFNKFNEDNQHSYFNKYDDAIAYAVQNSPPNATIYLSGVNSPYLFALYATKMPPQNFLNTVVYANPDGEFRHVVRFDRFIVDVPNSLNTGETGVFHKNEVSHNIKNQAKKITAFGNFLVVEN
ncbi:MAG: glycosyltransferase family 39 protein [Fibromonadaceae bacterium]|jgi:4-amino-4-deoxy-L-arabinose transferase-like glycosyltransferase|nr:glycosyltransferase family 39 protein [Fibromonadaceae bacterium]